MVPYPTQLKGWLSRGPLQPYWKCWFYLGYLLHKMKDWAHCGWYFKYETYGWNKTFRFRFRNEYYHALECYVKWSYSVFLFELPHSHVACEVVELRYVVFLSYISYVVFLSYIRYVACRFGGPTYEICLLSKYLLLITKELISYFGLQFFITYYFKGKEFSKANGVVFLWLPIIKLCVHMSLLKRACIVSKVCEIND